MKIRYQECVSIPNQVSTLLYLCANLVRKINNWILNLKNIELHTKSISSKVSFFVQCTNTQLIPLQKFNIQTYFSQFLWFFSLKCWFKGQIISRIHLSLQTDLCSTYALTCLAELCWVEGWINKDKGPWKLLLKVSRPLDFLGLKIKMLLVFTSLRSISWIFL